MRWRDTHSVDVRVPATRMNIDCWQPATRNDLFLLAQLSASTSVDCGFYFWSAADELAIT